MIQRFPSLMNNPLLLIGTLLIWTVLLGDASPVDSTTAASDRCIDFELNKVDALTTLANGSIFLVHSRQYWVLKQGEVPSLASGRPISKLIGGIDETGNDEGQTTIEAAVTVRVKAENGQCVPANQILLVSWTASNRSVVTIYENDVLYSTTNLSHVDIFQAARSVDWSRKIDGIAFWKEMTIIFQGDSFISIQCKAGRWVEILHKGIGETFPRITRKTPMDSVVVRKMSPTADESQATVVIFYGHEFFECSITGSDACEGPYSLMSDFFGVHQYCSDSTVGRAISSRRFFTALLLIVLILFSVCVVASILYFTLKPEHFTYFVNGKLSGGSGGRSNSNYNRDDLSYEALKLQSGNEGTVVADASTNTATATSTPVESKQSVNGNS